MKKRPIWMKEMKKKIDAKEMDVCSMYPPLFEKDYVMGMLREDLIEFSEQEFERSVKERFDEKKVSQT